MTWNRPIGASDDDLRIITTSYAVSTLMWVERLAIAPEVHLDAYVSATTDRGEISYRASH